MKKCTNKKRESDVVGHTLTVGPERVSQLKARPGYRQVPRQTGLKRKIPNKEGEGTGQGRKRKTSRERIQMAHNVLKCSTLIKIQIKATYHFLLIQW